ncbi:MAG: UvrB/UvrC motif-containing protein, partial [Alistipes sp.]|nr:UvrB/UvrC motif-containing protein [Alistipes sp.]
LAAKTPAPGSEAAIYPLAEDRPMMAADVEMPYGAGGDLDADIARAREEMERAAKSLDFLAAARFRDRMYELQKLRDEKRK